ncbi:flagellar biosynthetic protein FliO [Georhizobium sp. MAB10]|uniref:flagellar biosynthetic protein FliO n=1 Tax=Georhizobium sp. MAB10 TaxID=3028319 RepID=UPI003855CC85
MDGLFSGMLDERGSALVTAILAVSIALLALVVVYWIYRMRSGAPVTGLGGRGRRESRLAVVESAMVDTKRRIVLIRRDDVEHLILIGGPADVVVESGIGGSAQAPSIETDWGPSKEAEGQKAASTTGEPVRRAPEMPAPAPVATAPVAPAAAAAPKHFPAERFAQPSANSAEEPRVEGVRAGNPFDEAEFSAVLAAEMERNRPVKVTPFVTLDKDAAERAKASIPSIEPPQEMTPQQKKATSLQEEMARLLGEMKPERR